MYHEAWLPLVMKHLEPVITHLSPFFTARVFIPPTSEPASGSVRQNEASFGSSASIPRYFFFTSSDPPRTTGAEARPLAISDVPMPEQPQPSSSSIRHPDSRSRPGPPYASGSSAFISPTSHAFSTMLLRPRGVAVVFPGDRADLLLGEVVRQFAQVLLLVGEGEVNHAGCSFGR